jgi:hypothetical protein
MHIRPGRLQLNTGAVGCSFQGNDMSLKHTQKTFEKFGESDPLFAVATAGMKKSFSGPAARKFPSRSGLLKAWMSNCTPAPQWILAAVSGA